MLFRSGAAFSGAPTQLHTCLPRLMRWRVEINLPADVPELSPSSFFPLLSLLSAAIGARAELELAVALACLLPS